MVPPTLRSQIPWTGLIYKKGILTGLHLASMGLGNTINVDALSCLDALKDIYLQNNHFSGTIPDLHLATLSSLNVSHNSLEGLLPVGKVQLQFLRWKWQKRWSFNAPVDPSTIIDKEQLVVVTNTKGIIGLLHFASSDGLFSM